MIAKAYRFHGQNDLRYVYRKGSSVRTKYCSAKYTKTNRHNSYRASVVVSKKVAKSAPLRNRIRRRLYEQVRLQSDRIAPGTDIVITVHDQAVALIDTHEVAELVRRIISERTS